MVQGRPAEARAAAGELWPAADEPPRALVTLAKSAARAGQGELAAGLMMQAVALAPADADLHFEFGLLLTALGWETEAEREFRETAGRVGDADRLDMADRLRQAGRMGEAAGLYRSELSGHDPCARAWWGLALIAGADGLTDRAVDLMERAVASEPNNSFYRQELGLALAAAGDLNAALNAFNAARIFDPEKPDIHNNIGHTLGRLGRLKEAEAAFREAIGIDPGCTKAHYNLGRLYQNMSRWDDASACYQNVLAILPGHAESYNNLGTVLYSKGEWDRAAACYRRAQSLAPDYAESFHNMANLLVKRSEDPGAAIPQARQALELRRDYTEAAVILLDACYRSCSWDNLSEIEANAVRLSRKDLEIRGWSPENPICTIRTSFDQAHHLALAKGWARKMAETAAGENLSFSFASRKKRDTPIRLGYLSRDFRDHPVGHLMAGLFGLHDRNRFETFVYSGGPDDGSVFRTRVERECDRLVDVKGWSARQIAEHIYQGGIDILVDLTGHSGGSMLPVCALKPAPVRVAYLGYLGTSGADFMDYIITDATVTPEDAAEFYTEKFVYLPHCYQINDHRQPISEKIFHRRDFGLPESAFVFMCFNNLSKIDPLLFKTWMDILTRAPESVLWLYQGNRAAVSNLKKEAARQGVDPERLAFSGRLPLPEHLARLKLADLALDTRMYNGGATTSNALWAGVPVITILGRHFVSRMTASALKAVGLPEAVTRDVSQYRDLAIQWALDPEKLQAIKEKLNQNRQTRSLFDTPRFVLHLERAFEKMWALRQEGRRPEPIDLRKHAETGGGQCILGSERIGSRLPSE